MAKSSKKTSSHKAWLLVIVGFAMGLAAAALIGNWNQLFLNNSQSVTDNDQPSMATQPVTNKTMAFGGGKLMVTYPSDWYLKTDDPLYDAVLSDSSAPPDTNFVLSMSSFEGNKQKLGCSTCVYGNDRHITLPIGDKSYFILTSGYDNKVGTFVLSACQAILCLPKIPGTNIEFYYELVYFGHGGPDTIEFDAPQTQKALSIMKSLQGM